MKKKLVAMLLVVMMLVVSMPMALAEDYGDLEIQPRSNASVRASMTTSGNATGIGTSGNEEKTVTITVYRQSGNGWVYEGGNTKTAVAVSVSATTNVNLISNSRYKVVATCISATMSRPVSDTAYYNT